MVIDIDGVACAHAQAICEQVNREFGLSSSHDDVRTWNHDFGPITFEQAVDRYYANSEFILGMKPTEGFDSFLQQVKPFFKVVFATTRKHSRRSTAKWIRKNFGDSFDLEFVNSKFVLQPDVAIDDAPREIVAVAANSGIGILFTQPWNDNDNVDIELSCYDGITRASSFPHVVRILLDLDFMQ